MHWDVKDQKNRRKEFVLLCNDIALNFSLLCRRFGISRKTGYKWRARFKEHGEDGLADLPRPKSRRSNQTAPAIEQALLALRSQFPTWGPRKLRKKFSLTAAPVVPSASTVARLLKREGRIQPLRSRQSVAFTRFERAQPNQLWQMDFKGDFPMRNGARCHPLTIIDDHSRYLPGLFACDNQTCLTVREHLVSVFKRHGLPECILCDNGPPWGNTGAGLHTTLGVWLLRLGVRVIHGRPYHPQTQGKDERFHRTLKADLLTRHDWPDLRQAQERFDSYRQLYNHERPHEAHSLETPAQHYRVSAPGYPEILPPPAYDPGEITRLVKSKGEFTFKNRFYYLGAGFSGLHVALRPLARAGQYRVCLGSISLGSIDTAQPSTLPKGHYHCLCPQHQNLQPPTRYTCHP